MKTPICLRSQQSIFKDAGKKFYKVFIMVSFKCGGIMVEFFQLYSSISVVLYNLHVLFLQSWGNKTNVL